LICRRRSCRMAKFACFWILVSAFWKPEHAAAELRRASSGKKLSGLQIL
jgi:hypothetical protein